MTISITVLAASLAALAAGPALGQIASGSAATRCGAPLYVTVQRGMSLQDIAKEAGHGWRDIARWNGLDAASGIAVGQSLRVQPPDCAPAEAVAEPVADSSNTGRPASPQADAADASVTAMDRFVEDERRRLLDQQRQSKAKLAQIDEELDRQHAEQDQLVRRLRASLAPEMQRLDRLRGHGAELQDQVARYDSMLGAQPTPAQRRDIDDQRAKTVALIDDVHRLVATGVGAHPHGLAWRLPNGQLVLPRPDGRLVVVGQEIAVQRIDTATLPRPGDHFIEDRHRMAMVHYEESWTGAPSRDARIAALARSLDDLVSGTHECRTSVLGSITITNTPPTTGRSVSVDINKVFRLRERVSFGQGLPLEDRTKFVPLSRIDRLETRAATAHRTCPAILMRCTDERPSCVAPGIYGPDSGIDVAVLLHFADESRAQRALPMLRELLELARRP